MYLLFKAKLQERNDSLRTYTLLLEKIPNGYKQIIPEMGTGDNKIRLTEEYSMNGAGAASPIDGAWKLVKAFRVMGKDTTDNFRNQYKTYFAGHCIWGNTYTDSLKKIHIGIGFGKFEMNGTSKVKESMIASTYSEVRGHDFDIAIELKSSDEFMQTTNNPNGSRSVEVYQRLKN